MGNCWGTRVISHHSQTLPPTRGTSINYDNHKQLYGGSASKVPNNNKQPSATRSHGSYNGNDRAVQAEHSNYNTDTDNELRTSIVTPKLKMFTLSELKSATRNFRPDTMLGEGGFGTVFKGWVDEKTYAPSRVGVGMAVAVKKSKPDSSQGLKEWQFRRIFVISPNS